jgi:hypothetical protein
MPSGKTSPLSRKPTRASPTPLRAAREPVRQALPSRRSRLSCRPGATNGSLLLCGDVEVCIPAEGFSPGEKSLYHSSTARKTFFLWLTCDNGLISSTDQPRLAGSTDMSLIAQKSISQRFTLGSEICVDINQSRRLHCWQLLKSSSGRTVHRWQRVKKFHF